MKHTISLITFLIVLILIGCGGKGATNDKPFTGDLASVFPKEVNMKGATYRLLELGPLKPDSVKKYVKNLDTADGQTVLDALYISSEEDVEGILVARYPSAEEAGKALAAMNNDSNHIGYEKWTRSNLLFRATTRAFESQMK